MRKKNLILIIIFMTVVLLPIRVSANNVCDSINLNKSKSACEKNSNCSWNWINEGAGDGYCALKSSKPKCEDLSEEEKANTNYCTPDSCSYSVEIFSLDIGGNGKTKCTFTIAPTGNRNSLIIKWNDPKKNKSGEFGHSGVKNGEYYDSFMCYDESVYFWNANAGLKKEGPGDLEIIYDFKNKWNDIYNKSGQCPKISYVSDAGNTYLYFPNEDNSNEPPSTAGGSNDAGGNASQDSEPEQEPEPDVDGDKIKDQYIGNMTCGGLTNFTFHKRIPKLTSTLYNLLKFAIPVLLVIKGMLDMFKAMSAGKEDEIKKVQKKFINRLIAALSAFIVFILVETVIGWLASKTDDNEGAMKCVDCFINGPDYCEILENKSNNYETTNGFTTPFKKGINYTVTDEFGSRINPVSKKPEHHLGIDLSATEGTDIVASAPGTVVLSQYSESAGNYVIIEHNMNNKKYYTVYMHMNERFVNVSQKVSAKQKIGVIGNTGQATRTHLHFEICSSTTRNSTTCYNPRNFINF